MSDTITIKKSEYDYLIDRDLELTALENGGVDNWEWYEESLKEYKKYKEDKELRTEIENRFNDPFSDMIDILLKGISADETGCDFEGENMEKAKNILIDEVIKCIKEREAENE